MSIKLPSSVLRYLVLYSCRDEPSYGYEVVSSIEELSGNNWSPSSGTVYPLIDRLKDECLLRELDQNEIDEKELEGDDRNYFIITEKGAEELDEVVENAEEHREEFGKLILGYLNIYGKTYGFESLEDLFDEVLKDGSVEDSC
mgnify:FL=1